jgi:sulfur carrier protein
MITIEFNGQSKQVLIGTTVEQLLLAAGVPAKFCAVERNLEIVSKDKYGECVLEEGDSIEVVTLVGGG